MWGTGRLGGPAAVNYAKLNPRGILQLTQENSLAG